MKEDKLKRLKEVLSIPTKSRREELMISYLKGVLDEKGYDYTVDRLGNIYVTKGVAEWYPCFVAHTDTVHEINHNLTVIETNDNGNLILTGIDKVTGKPSGIGGDDKCGVYLCLEMLDHFDNVKVALFVSEEIGCIGSKEADKEFFSNVGYAIQYDSPEGNSMSMSLMGMDLFDKEDGFGQKVSPLILEHGIDYWARHPFTDVKELLQKFNFSCLNLAAGYYRMHSSNEYVVVNDVQNAFELGLKLVEVLGYQKYERPKKLLYEEKKNWWGGYSRNNYGNGGINTNKPKPIIETHFDEEEEDFFDDWVEINFGDEFEDDEITDIKPLNGFEDKFDYNDFNGGYSIRKYGTEHNFRDLDFEW